MGEITGLYSYPLVSGLAIEHAQMPVGPFGPLGDREFVAASPGPNPGEPWQRINQKGHPELARAGIVNEGPVEILEVAGQGRVTLPDSQSRDIQASVVSIDEFDDIVPVIDLGYSPAKLVRNLVNVPQTRLLAKHSDWVSGKIGPAPDKRRAAPLHVLSMATIRELQKRAKDVGKRVSENGAELRANIIVDDPEIGPFEETSWVGRTALVGGLEIYFHRATPRCPIPGVDQKSGERVNVIPTLWKDLEKNERGKPIVGVYAVPQILGSDTVNLATGQPFELL